MVSTSPTRHALRATPRNEIAAQIADLGSILGVWAHPDDEVYLSEGIIRLALENGQRVVCITATSGERGTDDPLTWPPEVLGPTRRTELQSSFAALAADQRRIEHHWLDYRDGHCADIKPTDAATEIGAAIDRVQPDTILTFDPKGLTGHSDHQAICEWVSMALETSAAISHLEAVVARSWADHLGDGIDLSDLFDAGYPHIVDDEDIAPHLVLDDALWDIKNKALRAHATQVGLVIDNLGLGLRRAFNTTESFTSHTTTSPRKEASKDHSQ